MKVSKRANCCPCMHSIQIWKGFEAKDGQLLPGILNEVTLNLIVPKLPWRAFHVLSLVSPAWLHAVRNHEVYRARVRSLSTDTSVVISYPVSKCMDGIALYSVSDDSYSKLPQIPGRHGGFPKDCQGVSLDGKLYLLGGLLRNKIHASSREVHVLDLAGQRQWERCASMITAREEFTSGVMHGKIYAFGGTSSHKFICESEVYDPRKNVWTPIKPMRSMFTGLIIAVVGEEFVFYGRTHFEDGEHREEYLDMEVYHPLTDEWRVVERFWKNHDEELGRHLFHAQGKFHSTYFRDIDVQDDANWWAPLHRSSVHAICPELDDEEDIYLLNILVLEDQLLGTLVFPRRYKSRGLISATSRLVRTRGLGGNNKEMEWKATKFLLSTEWDCTLGSLSLLCPVQL